MRRLLRIFFLYSYVTIDKMYLSDKESPACALKNNRAGFISDSIVISCSVFCISGTPGCLRRTIVFCPEIFSAGGTNHGHTISIFLPCGTAIIIRVITFGLISALIAAAVSCVFLILIAAVVPGIIRTSIAAVIPGIIRILITAVVTALVSGIILRILISGIIFWHFLGSFLYSRRSCLVGTTKKVCVFFFNLFTKTKRSAVEKPVIHLLFCNNFHKFLLSAF